VMSYRGRKVFSRCRTDDAGLLPYRLKGCPMSLRLPRSTTVATSPSCDERRRHTAVTKDDFLGRVWGARQRKKSRDIERCGEMKPLIRAQMGAASQVTETSRPTFQGGSTGSNPVGATSKRASQKDISVTSLHLNYSPGARLVRVLSEKKGIQPVWDLVLCVLVEVPITVQRECDRRMPGPHRDLLGVSACGDPESNKRVS
jgi:hypothetical protein